MFFVSYLNPSIIRFYEYHPGKTLIGDGCFKTRTHTQIAQAHSKQLNFVILQDKQ